MLRCASLQTRIWPQLIPGILCTTTQSVLRKYLAPESFWAHSWVLAGDVCLCSMRSDTTAASTRLPKIVATLRATPSRRTLHPRRKRSAPLPFDRCSRPAQFLSGIIWRFPSGDKGEEQAAPRRAEHSTLVQLTIVRGSWKDVYLASGASGPCRGESYITDDRKIEILGRVF